MEREEGRRKKKIRRRCSSGLYIDAVGIEELRELFHLPLTKAAQQLGCGATVLKRRCRQLGVPSWPYLRPTSEGAGPRQAALDAQDGVELALDHRSSSHSPAGASLPAAAGGGPPAPAWGGLPALPQAPGPYQQAPYWQDLPPGQGVGGTDDIQRLLQAFKSGLPPPLQRHSAPAPSDAWHHHHHQQHAAAAAASMAAGPPLPIDSSADCSTLTHASMGAEYGLGDNGRNLPWLAPQNSPAQPAAPGGPGPWALHSDALRTLLQGQQAPGDPAAQLSGYLAQIVQELVANPGLTSRLRAAVGGLEAATRQRPPPQQQQQEEEVYPSAAAEHARVPAPPVPVPRPLRQAIMHRGTSPAPPLDESPFVMVASAQQPHPQRQVAEPARAHMPAGGAAEQPPALLDSYLPASLQLPLQRADLVQAPSRPLHRAASAPGTAGQRRNGWVHVGREEQGQGAFTPFQKAAAPSAGPGGRPNPPAAGHLSSGAEHSGGAATAPPCSEPPAGVPWDATNLLELIAGGAARPASLSQPSHSQGQADQQGPWPGTCPPPAQQPDPAAPAGGSPDRGGGADIAGQPGQEDSRLAQLRGLLQMVMELRRQGGVRS